MVSQHQKHLPACRHILLDLLVGRLILSVQKLIPDKKLRCDEIAVEAGGGGINISKAIKRLGGKSVALFPSGGANGKQLEDLLIKEGIEIKVIPIAGETRAGFAVTDLSTDSQYRFVAPGPFMTEEVLETCLKEVENFKPAPDTVIFSGSLPPGVRIEPYYDRGDLVAYAGRARSFISARLSSACLSS